MIEHGCPSGPPKTCSPADRLRAWVGVNSASLASARAAAISFLPFLSNRYYARLAPFASTSDWTGFSRRYRELTESGCPACRPTGRSGPSRGRRAQLRRLADELRRRLAGRGRPASWMTIWFGPACGSRARDTPSLSMRTLHDRDRAVSRSAGVSVVALRRHGLEDDLEAALEVEAEGRASGGRRARDRDQERADERGDDQRAIRRRYFRRSLTRLG